MTGRPARPIESRFWDKVVKTDGCWLWASAKDSFGYPLIKRSDGAQIRAHRLSYEMHKGAIPAGHFVCHKCDNKGCVNPDHLFAGTHQQNMDDMVSKSRAFRHIGEKNYSAKLTPEQVIAIRGESGSCAKIGKKYGVSEMAISKIRRNITWRHVA